MSLIKHWLAGFRRWCYIVLIFTPDLLLAYEGEGIHWLANPLDERGGELYDQEVSFSKLDNLLKQQLIDWVLSMPEHGIAVSPQTRARLTPHSSMSTVRKIVAEYAGYLDQGRLDRSKYQPHWYIKDQAITPLQDKDLNLSNLNNLEPKLPQYQQLKQTLAVLREWLKQAPRLFHSSLILKPGQQNEAVTALGKWLNDIGVDYRLSGSVYSSAYQTVIRRLQRYGGIRDDGRFGLKTRALLMTVTRQRIKSIKINMERIRWLPQNLAYPHIMVDIAGFQVIWAENKQNKSHYRAIVGKPDRQTPVFQDQIESITVNPTWRVPHSIASTSLLRAEQRSPGFLKKQGFVIYNGWGSGAKTLLPEAIDWQNQTARHFPYRLEQKPGVYNRLGKFKLDLPNAFSVYLHDTDKPQLFRKAVRTFSAGCTRVEGIEQLVGEIFRSQNIDDDVREIYSLNSTEKIKLKSKVPIYFVYFTAWSDNDAVEFRGDIYRLDNIFMPL